MLRHARACFTRVRVPGSALRRLTGAAVVGGAGAVALGASPATCESSRHWYGDPFSWDSPLSSFLFEPFGLAQHDRARLFALDRPGVQVTEAADGYEFSVALPGVRPADLDVSVEGGVLLLKGTARHGSFERRLRLPRDADGSASSATFEDGLLSLTVPRAAAAIAKEIKVTRDAEPATPPEGALSFQLELPGLRPEDLRVAVQAGELVVSGESQLRSGWYRVNRRFSLPRHAEAHQASASLTDGVLTVTIPTEEAAEEAPTKRVKIVPASKA